MSIIDVDKTWDGTGSLDDHRTKALKEIEQPGFGDAGKPKVTPEPQQEKVQDGE